MPSLNLGHFMSWISAPKDLNLSILDKTDSLTSGSSPGWSKHSSIMPILIPLIDLSKSDK